ncbi:MAG: hypothetical protein M1831_004703 [Alyxoria varia]|nr:MAG: hypothetical protein M1831_004703 [Alyxoria varia]
MTEVIYPNQLAETRSSEYPAPSTEWFLPTSYLSNSTGHQLTNQSTHRHAESQTRSRGSRSPTRKVSQSPQRSTVPSGSFTGVGTPISQQSSPFMQSSSQPTNQPTLYSNTAHTAATSAPTSTPRTFAPIAPDPVGLQRIQANKISQEQEAANEAYQNSRKRKGTASSMDAPQPPPPLRDEDKLLLQLKDEQQLPWKDIASQFQSETGKPYMIPALQMRYKRLKERLQVWTETDVEALKQAHEYWETRKFEIISAKMLEFGATDKFSARSCQRKWQDLNPGAEFLGQQLPPYPPAGALSQSSSPQPFQPRQPPYVIPTSAYHSQGYPPTNQHLPNPGHYMPTSHGQHATSPYPSTQPQTHPSYNPSTHRMGGYPSSPHASSGYWA